MRVLRFLGKVLIVIMVLAVVVIVVGIWYFHPMR